MKRLSLFIYILSSVNIFAGHPLKTDDAAALGNDFFQIELLSDFHFEAANRAMDVPLAFSYGLSQNSDLVFSLPLNNPSHNYFNGMDMQDISVELKYIFIQEQVLNFGLKPVVSFPTGNCLEGNGTGKIGTGLTAISSLMLNGYNIHFNAGYYYNNNNLDERFNLFYFSTAAEIYVSEKFNLVMGTGIENNSSKYDENYPFYFIGGFVYNFSEAIAFDVGLEKGFDGGESKTSLLTGLTILIN